MRSIRRIKTVPRRKRCLVIVLLLAIFQLFSIFLYSLSASGREDNAILSQLDNLDFAKARTFVQTWFKSKKEELVFNESLESKMSKIDLDDPVYWKFQNKLRHTELTVPLAQLEVPNVMNNFDPRLTYALYLSYMRQQYALRNPHNEETLADDSKKIYVPFHWSDWVDLSLLNVYLALPEAQRPTCDVLYPQKRDTPTGSRRKKINGHPIPPEQGADADTAAKDAESKPADHSAYCLNNAQYAELHGLEHPDDLVGFNVLANGPKGSWDKKLVQAKSFLYSTFPAPRSVVFLAGDGIYEAFTDARKKLRGSELVQSFVAAAGRESADADDDAAAPVVRLDPLREFGALQAQIPAHRLAGNRDVTLDELVMGDADLQVHLNHSSFVYDYPKIIADYEAAVGSGQKLTSKQQAHYEALKYSQSVSSMRLSKHFQEVAIQGSTPNTKESGGHFDWRFFNGFISLSKVNDFDDVAEKKRIILHRLLKVWLQFTYNTNIVTWIAHGSLLSWYWDGISFPWDVDIDVQMPVMELDRFSLMFNHSLIVENVEEGFGKFFVDCSSFLTHRTKGNGRNNIDARFIDVDSGFYIDITGLSLTNTQVSDRYRGSIEQDKVDAVMAEMRRDKAAQQQLKGRKAKEELLKGVSVRYAENLSLQAYNCRNNHFYRLQELSPLRVSLIEGAKTLIPNAFKGILKAEYTRGMTVTTFNRHVYFPQLRLWLPFEVIYEALKDEVEKINQRAKRPSRTKRVTATKITRLMKEIDEAMIYKLLDNEDVLKEYYLTKDITRLHQQEMEALESGESARDFVVENVVARKFDPLRKDVFMFRQEVANFGQVRTTLEDDDALRQQVLSRNVDIVAEKEAAGQSAGQGAGKAAGQAAGAEADAAAQPAQDKDTLQQDGSFKQIS